MGVKRRLQLWSARKQGKAYKTPAAAPSLEYRTLELMTDRKKSMLDNLNYEVTAFLNAQRYKSELQPENCSMMGSCLLGRMFLKSGSDLPEDSAYGNTLIKSGQVLCRIGEIQTDADQCIRERFLRPMIKTLEEDIRHFEYERRQIDERRVDFELTTSRWERRRGDVDLETKMITARNRYESSLRSLQDLMLRINMREQEEVEATRCFFIALLHEFREAANLIEGALPSVFDPSVRGDPIHRPLAELPQNVRPRISTANQLAPYQVDLPPAIPAIYWNETRGPAPLGGVGEQQGNFSERYDVNNQQQQQQQQQQQPQAQQSQMLQQQYEHTHFPHQHYTSSFQLPPRDASQNLRSSSIQNVNSSQYVSSYSSPYIAVKQSDTNDFRYGSARPMPVGSEGYYYGSQSRLAVPSADQTMLSSQYVPLSGTSSRVKTEQFANTGRSATPQTSPIRSPDEDPSRWANQEAKVTRASSSYDVDASTKINAGDSVKVSSRSNDGNWVYGEVNNRKFVLPAKMFEA